MKKAFTTYELSNTHERLAAHIVCRDLEDLGLERFGVEAHEVKPEPMGGELLADMSHELDADIWPAEDIIKLAKDLCWDDYELDLEAVKNAYRMWWKRAADNQKTAEEAWAETHGRESLAQ